MTGIGTKPTHCIRPLSVSLQPAPTMSHWAVRLKAVRAASKGGII
jgi:hypothetical protein